MISRLVAAAAAIAFTAAATLPAGTSPTSAPSPARIASEDGVTQVIAISIDGLNPVALRRLGREGAPHLHAFREAGASTMNARTERELTVTLPNHTGMVTGRRVDADRGGHGVTWNDDRRRPATVHAAAGHPVESVFSVVDDAGGTTALFASKTKFSLWTRSWPDDIHRTTIDLDNVALTRSFVADVQAGPRTFRFLHLSLPDDVGHARGWLTRPYLRAVRRVDRLVGEVVASVTTDGELSSSVAIVLTSDHGGLGRDHHEVADRANYRIPFMVRGPGVTPGADLYDLNPDYLDPGRGRPGYGADRQPVRNGALANLALDLLDLAAVPGSEHNVARDLDVSLQP